ncbi:MAG: accessory factor UbiK family protein [Gammaproteobacteria bacterium]|nr:accessory factor UbiK family protein [Gammaproteobacteria bacterium]
MLDPKIIEDLSRHLSNAVPEGARVLKQDLERNFRAVLNGAFTRLDLVTREELEVQENLLARTRELLDGLAARVDELERRLRDRAE